MSSSFRKSGGEFTMENLKRIYSIAFAGLKLGKHNFEYSVNSSFFDQFENSLIEKASMDVSLVLDKHENMLILEFTLKGTISVECDRCTELFELPVKGSNKLIVKLGDQEEDTNEDEIVVISRNENSINIAPHIYEYISLMVPLKKVHRTLKECNQETITVLEKLAVKNNSKKDKNDTDPRWNALKDLIKKN